MSDDLLSRLKSPETFINSAGVIEGFFSGVAKDAADRIEAQAAEIARLRDAPAALRSETKLNPDRWRGAINDALTNWLDTIRDEDVPKDALRRLVAYEVTAALDPAVSQAAADLVATARLEGMEEAAKIADSCGADWAKSAKGKFVETKWDYESRADAADEIAAAIRAAAKEGK